MGINALESGDSRLCTKYPESVTCHDPLKREFKALTYGSGNSIRRQTESYCLGPQIVHFAHRLPQQEFQLLARITYQKIGEKYLHVCP